MDLIPKASLFFQKNEGSKGFAVRFGWGRVGFSRGQASSLDPRGLVARFNFVISSWLMAKRETDGGHSVNSLDLVD